LQTKLEDFKNDMEAAVFVIAALNIPEMENRT
jgi:hypothetical protein